MHINRGFKNWKRLYAIPLNVSFNGSGITVDVDNGFVECITKGIVDSLIYDAFCDEVDYVLTKYIGGSYDATGVSNNAMSASEVEQELREIVYKHRIHYKQFCWRVWVMIKFNMNNYVWFEPTELGLQVFVDYYKSHSFDHKLEVVNGKACLRFHKFISIMVIT